MPQVVRKFHFLKERHQELGIQITGGLKTVRRGIFISHLLDGTVAAKDGRLNVNDEILFVNGHPLISASLQKAISVLKGVSNPIQIVISREVEAEVTPVQNDTLLKENEEIHTEKCATRIITLYCSSEDKLGFSVVGGIDSQCALGCGVYVKAIQPAGLAAIDGRLKIGDEILSINNQVFHDLTHQQVVSLFKNVSDERVQLCVKVQSSKQQLDAIHTIYVTKVTGRGLGIGIGVDETSEIYPGIFIKYITKHGDISKENIKINDQLLSINSHLLQDAGLDDAYKILHSLKPGKVSLELKRSKSIMGDKKSAKERDGFVALMSPPVHVKCSTEIEKESVPISIYESKASDEESIASVASSLVFDSINNNQIAEERPPLPGVRKTSGWTSLSSNTTSSDRSAEQTNALDYMILDRDHNGNVGFGIKITKEMYYYVVFVKSVAKNGPADNARGSKTGGFRVGDEIVQVNDQVLSDISVKDIVDVFKRMPLTSVIVLKRKPQGTEDIDAESHVREKSMILCEKTALKPLVGSGDATGGRVNHACVKKLEDVQIPRDVPEGMLALLVEVEKGDNVSLGVSLVPCSQKCPGYFQVRRILPGSAAEKDGQLSSGDVIYSTNGITMNSMTHPQALQILKQDCVKMKFVIFREKVRDSEPSPRNTVPKKQSKVNTLPGTISHQQQKLANQLANRRKITCSMPVNFIPHLNNELEHTDEVEGKVCSETKATVNEELPTCVAVNKRCPSEAFLVEYERIFKSLGIEILMDTNNHCIVTNISSTGLAAKNDLLQVGDELLAVNDQPLRGKAVSVANNLIQKIPRGKVQLLVKAGNIELPEQRKPVNSDEESLISSVAITSNRRPTMNDDISEFTDLPPPPPPPPRAQLPVRSTTNDLLKDMESTFSSIPEPPPPVDGFQTIGRSRSNSLHGRNDLTHNYTCMNDDERVYDHVEDDRFTRRNITKKWQMEMAMKRNLETKRLLSMELSEPLVNKNAPLYEEVHLINESPNQRVTKKRSLLTKLKDKILLPNKGSAKSPERKKLSPGIKASSQSDVTLLHRSPSSVKRFASLDNATFNVECVTTSKQPVKRSSLPRILSFTKQKAKTSVKKRRTSSCDFSPPTSPPRPPPCEEFPLYDNASIGDGRHEELSTMVQCDSSTSSTASSQGKSSYAAEGPTAQQESLDSSWDVLSGDINKEIAFINASPENNESLDSTLKTMDKRRGPSLHQLSFPPPPDWEEEDFSNHFNDSDSPNLQHVQNLNARPDCNHYEDVSNTFRKPNATALNTSLSPRMKLKNILNPERRKATTDRRDSHQTEDIGGTNSVTESSRCDKFNRANPILKPPRRFSMETSSVEYKNVEIPIYAVPFEEKKKQLSQKELNELYATVNKVPRNAPNNSHVWENKTSIATSPQVTDNTFIDVNDSGRTVSLDKCTEATNDDYESPRSSPRDLNNRISSGSLENSTLSQRYADDERPRSKPVARKLHETQTHDRTRVSVGFNMRSTRDTDANEAKKEYRNSLLETRNVGGSHDHNRIDTRPPRDHNSKIMMSPRADDVPKKSPRMSVCESHGKNMKLVVGKESGNESGNERRRKTPVYGTFSTELLKEPGKSLGITITGGADTKVDKILVKFLQQDSVAKRCSIPLRVGDEVVKINNVVVTGCSHAMVLDTLKCSPPLVSLTLHRPVDGNKDLLLQSEIDLLPAKLTTESFLASQSNTEICSIDERKLNGSKNVKLSTDTFERTQKPTALKKRANSFCSLSPISPAHATSAPSGTPRREPQNAFIQLYIELKKVPGKGLGIGVYGGPRLTIQSGIKVKKLVEDSIAGMDGRLRSNDLIVSVNDTPLQGLTQGDALGMLKSIPETVVLKVIRNASRPSTPARNLDSRSRSSEDLRVARILHASSEAPVKFPRRNSLKDLVVKTFSKNANKPSMHTVYFEKYSCNRLGFTIEGGEDTLYGRTPFLVRTVTDGFNSELQKGDQIVTIQGLVIKDFTLREVCEFLVNLPLGRICMTILRRT